MNSEMNDNVDLVMCTLMDVLGEKKFALIDKNDVIKELSDIEMDADVNKVIDYSGIFHPYKKIDSVVKHFVCLHKKRKLAENSFEEGGEVDASINAEIIRELEENEKTKILRSLTFVYPDVDQKLLHQICARLQYDPPKISAWLETNIGSIPEKRQVQAIHRFTLESSCGPDEAIWCCPGCETWQVVGRKLEVVRCGEVVSCGEFCLRCGRKEHHPFGCRARCERIDNMENDMNIFKKLGIVPDEDKGFAKIFILNPVNNLDFSNPLHILFLAAEGTFLRMIDLSNKATPLQATGGQPASASSSVSPPQGNIQASGAQAAAASSSVSPSQGYVQASGAQLVAASLSVSPPAVAGPSNAASPTFVVGAGGSNTTVGGPMGFLQRSIGWLSRGSSNVIKIKRIKYIENEELRGRFNSCKSYFLSRGIPNSERLVFHGTNSSLDSIIKHNFKLSFCKRFAHGKGIYFSEFPSTSQLYGQKLLLCRVMVGNHYEGPGGGKEHTIPTQYQSKLVQPDQEGKANMIIIDNVDQILPAFIIELI